LGKELAKQLGSRMESGLIIPSKDKDYSLIVKLTSRCNLRCRYCYHFKHLMPGPDVSDMTPSIIAQTIEQLIRHNCSHAHFIWHGGEPLLKWEGMVDFIVGEQEKACKKYGKPSLRVSNAIQTNGTLLTNEIIEELVAHGFHVGISLDGFEALHKENRHTTRTQYGTIVDALAHLGKLSARYGVLCVVGNNSIGHESEILHSFIRSGAKNIGLLPLIVCNATGELGKDTITPQLYGEFMCKFFHAWLDSGVKGISIREFDDFLRFRQGVRKKMCVNSGECDIYYTVMPDGNIYPCDCFASSEKNYLRNVCDGLDGLEHVGPIRELMRASTLVPARCQHCAYKEMCKGGCSYYRWIADRYFNSPSYFCAAYRMLYQCIDESLRDNGLENG